MVINGRLVFDLRSHHTDKLRYLLVFVTGVICYLVLMLTSFMHSLSRVSVEFCDPSRNVTLDRTDPSFVKLSHP